MALAKHLMQTKTHRPSKNAIYPRASGQLELETIG